MTFLSTATIQSSSSLSSLSLSSSSPSTQTASLSSGLLSTLALAAAVAAAAATVPSPSPPPIFDITKMLQNDVDAFNQSFALQRLFHNDKFFANISKMLNISSENLTTLLDNMKNNDLWEEQLAAPNTQMTLLVAQTICYVLIFIAGVLGNLITCIVISRNNFMHTATNFYLFNLAISDLILLCAGMPQELYNIWNPGSYPFTNFICIVGSMLSETAANATVLTITAFTVERYIAICHPFRQHTMSKLSRAIKFIFAIWLMAFLLALPLAMQFSVVPNIGGGYACTMENVHRAHAFALSGFIFFVGPMTAICALYVLIGVKLKRSRLLQSLPRRSYDVNRSLNAQSRVIRMLVAVAVAFFLCWAPFHAQRLIAVYSDTLISIGIDKDTINSIFPILDCTSGVLYYLSTCINPLLYNIMSHKFREAFKITLTRQFGLSSKQQSQNHNYSALMRQNGSLRFHTTVNNNALEHFGSYRVVQFRCRDPSHHYSMQDSIRTTTTTTTLTSLASNTLVGAATNGGMTGSGGNSRHSSHRNRCISIGSQTALMTPLHKNDVVPPQTVAQKDNAAGMPPHHTLQTQMSQLSSMGDANSLLEAEDDAADVHYLAHSNSRTYRQKRALIATHNGAMAAIMNASECQNWSPQFHGLKQRQTQETELMYNVQPLTPPYNKRLAMATGKQAKSALTEHSMAADMAEGQPATRSRLKLSRIITRRDQDAMHTQPSTRVELMHNTPRTLAEQLNVQKNKTKSNPNKKFDNLTERLHWRTRRQHTDHESLRKTKKLSKKQGNIVVSPSAGSPETAELRVMSGCLGYDSPNSL